jgi:tetratricopeptide (TPR) repeat protein
MQKRLYVHDEQGFGDTIQFVRYLPQVKALGGTVILGTRKALVASLQGCAGIDQVIDRDAGGDPAAGCDLVVPLLSLPGILGTDLESIPAEIPYLYADAAKVSYWKGRISPQGLKVGLVWAGNPGHDRDHARSIELNDLICLANIPGLQLYGLQKGAAAGQVKGLAADKNLINLGCEFEDFSDTAAVIANMDLIISVDTAVAHLAGAMGVPVWTLVYFAPDWRWMLDREDSPWYPTMRLFRQQKAGDWTGAIGRIIAEFKVLIQGRGSGHERNASAGIEIAARHCQDGGGAQAKEPHHPDAPDGPDQARTLHQLGVAAHGAGNYEEALTLISRAVALDQQNPHYFYNFGRVCACLGDSQAAINAYGRAIHLKPDYIEAYGSLGAALKNQMRLDEALDLYDQVLKIVPAEPKLHYGRGQVLSAQGHYDKAIEAFNTAIGLNPEAAVFYNSLGVARGLSGDQPGAMKAFEQALRLQPDLAEAVNNMGTAVQEEGEFDRAIEYFDRAIQIRPDYGEVVHIKRSGDEIIAVRKPCRAGTAHHLAVKGCVFTVSRAWATRFSSYDTCPWSRPLAARSF